MTAKRSGNAALAVGSALCVAAGLALLFDLAPEATALGVGAAGTALLFLAAVFLSLLTDWDHFRFRGRF